MSVNKPRLGLESLEAREVPAIAFAGGWGASMDQQVDPSNPNLVYIGGSRRAGWTTGPITEVKFGVRPTAPSRDFPMDIRGVDAGSRGVQRDGVLDIRDSLALGHISHDQFVFGVESPRASAPGSLGVEVHVVRSADPLPVLLVIADQRDFYEGGGAGRDVLLGGAVADTRPLRRGNWLFDVSPLRGVPAADDVVVDCRVITAENAAVDPFGYVKIKKLNSGG